MILIYKFEHVFFYIKGYKRRSMLLCVDLINFSHIYMFRKRTVITDV